MIYQSTLLFPSMKFSQIDEDVQRHNELLEVVRATAPSELGEIISRRRKDFTKEFFVHLHTVAESYYDDPAEQNGNTAYFLVGKVVMNKQLPRG